MQTKTTLSEQFQNKIEKPQKETKSITLKYMTHYPGMTQVLQ